MTHTIRQQVHDSIGFVLPDEYLALLDAGSLRFGRDRDDWMANWKEIVLTSPPALVCSPWHATVEWFTTDQMLAWQSPVHWKPNRFVSFAGNGYGDRWCWDPDRECNGATPIVLCRHDENETEIYSAKFGDFLYRIILESLAQISYDDRDELDVDDATYKRYLSLNIDTVESSISPNQVKTLRKILTNDFLDDEDEECYCLVSADEQEAIVQRELMVGEVGSTFQHMVKPEASA